MKYLIPARAGMILEDNYDTLKAWADPRTRGDDPERADEIFADVH